MSTELSRFAPLAGGGASARYPNRTPNGVSQYVSTLQTGNTYHHSACCQASVRRFITPMKIYQNLYSTPALNIVKFDVALRPNVPTKPLKGPAMMVSLVLKLAVLNFT